MVARRGAEGGWGWFGARAPTPLLSSPLPPPGAHSPLGAGEALTAAGATAEGGGCQFPSCPYRWFLPAGTSRSGKDGESRSQWVSAGGDGTSRDLGEGCGGAARSPQGRGGKIWGDGEVESRRSRSAGAPRGRERCC